jgi:hypothetical protein
MLITVGSDGAIVEWDLTANKQVRAMSAPQAGGGGLVAMAISPDGKWLAVGGGADAQLFEVATGKKVRQLGTVSSVSSIDWSPDGALIAVATGAAELFGANGDPIATFTYATGKNPNGSDITAQAIVFDVRWIAGSQKLVATSDTLFLLDAKQRRAIARDKAKLSMGRHPVVTSRDGRSAAVVVDDGLEWHALPSLAKTSTWKLDTIGALATSADGTLIAVDTSDGVPGSRGVVKILDAAASELSVLRTLAVFDTAATLPISPTSPPTAAPANGSEKVIHEVTYAAEVVLRENDQTSKKESAKHAKACSAAVSAALSANVAPTTEIHIANVNSDVAASVSGARAHPDRDGIIISLANIRDHVCVKGTSDQLVSNVSARASEAAVWIGKIQHVDKDRDATTSMMEYAVKTGAACKQAVAAARTGGIADATPVEFHVYTATLTSPLSLADIETKVCDAVTRLGTRVIAARDAAEKEKYAPYLKALSGDKATMFWEKRMLGGENWYGHGGKRLTKPADFAGSDVWYYYVVDRNGITPRWEVEGWTFKGDKRSGVYDTSGAGDTPPPSAFR